MPDNIENETRLLIRHLVISADNGDQRAKAFLRMPFREVWNIIEAELKKRREQRRVAEAYSRYCH